MNLGPGPYFPAFLNIRGKSVLVVGGGAVAIQKTRDLLRAQARITVIAKRFQHGFPHRGLVLHQRAFRPTDVLGRWLVVCATDDEALNARVSKICLEKRVFANIVDRTRLCSYIVPAVVRRGNITFAISTGGASPGLAKLMRKKVQKYFGREYGQLAHLLHKWRPTVLKLPQHARRAFVKRVVRDETLSNLKKRGTRDTESVIKDIYDLVIKNS